MSLWADIDEYLQTQLIAELGSGGSYTSQVVRQVILDDIMDFTGATRLDNYPVVLVRSSTATQAPGPHGGGSARVENTYDYQLVGVLKATGQAQCKRDVQEMRRRLREFLRTRLALGGLTSTDDGERVQKVTWGRSLLEVWANEKQPGTFFGVTAMEFKVITI
jgi:hypothetical protein